MSYVWPATRRTVTPLGGVRNGFYCKPTLTLNSNSVLLSLGVAPPHVLRATARGTLSALPHDQQGFAFRSYFQTGRPTASHLSHHPQCHDAPGPAARAQCPL